MAEERKRKEAVVSSGKVKRKGFLATCAEYYMPDEEELRDIPNKIIYTMFVPAIFEAICDALTNSVEMFFHGSTSGRRRGKRKFDDPLDYNKASSKKSTTTTISDRDERIDGVDIFVSGTIRDVDKFLDILDEDLEEFDYVSVSDVYERAHIKQSYTRQAKNDRWGWQNLDDVTYKKGSEKIDGEWVSGYYVHFPKPTLQA